MTCVQPQRLSLNFALFLAAAIAATGAVFAFPTPPAQAYIADSLGISPDWKWKEIQTEHFRITYPLEMTEVARKASEYFEEAHRTLSPRLRWEPAKRTQVLLYDNSDAANGLAAAVLRLGVILYITPPEPWFSTSYYDDWLRLVVFHEYTHFLNMDPTRGIWKPLRWVLGDTPLPNATLPNWMLEGLAVWFETRFTSAGRGRSPYWRAILRAAVEENLLGDPSLVSLDLLNGETVEFPDGEIPYLYGYEMMNQIVRSAPPGSSVTYDREDSIPTPEDRLGILSERGSRRIPYFINGNVENITGRTWTQHWRDWLKVTRARMQDDLARIRAAGSPDEYRPIERNFDSLRGIRVSPDGNWATWINDGSDRRTGLHLKNLKTGQAARIGDQMLGAGTAFLPDSSALVFASGRRRQSYFLFDDLHLFDIRTNRLVRLSDGLRARDPDVSPDGKSLVFASSDSRGAVQLSRAALKRDGTGTWSIGTIEVLHHPGFLGRVSNPRFRPDGRAVIFSEHTNGQAQENLMELNLSDHTLSQVVADGQFNRMPVFHPKTGELHYISDKTGVETLWKISKEGRPSQVLQVTTGLWFPEIAPGGEIHAARLGARGWDWVVFKGPNQPLETERTTAHLLAPLPAPGGPAQEHPRKAAATSSRLSEVEQDYSPWPSLLPRQWVPYLAATSNNFTLGVTGMGFDATDRHSYEGQFEWNTAFQQLNVDLTYENRLFGPTLALRPSLISSSGYFEYDSDREAYDLKWTRSPSIDLQLYWPYQLTWSSLTPIFMVSVFQEDSWQRSEDPDTGALGAATQTASGGSGLFLEGRINYDDTEGSSLAISSERGGVSSFGLRGIANTSDIPRWKVGAFHRHHLALGLSHHVLIPEIVTAWSLLQDQGSTSTSEVILSGGSSANGGLLESLLPTGPGGSNPLTTVSIRGYPDSYFTARGTLQTSLDYRFPLLRIFRGWETLPWVFRNLSGEFFLENTLGFFRDGNSLRTVPLPSAGGGLQLTSKIFVRVPMYFSVQYHQGLNDTAGGKGNLVTSLSVGSLL